MTADVMSSFSVFLISESKLDSSFPNSQFKIYGYEIFRRDQSRYDWGLLLYVNEEIPCNFWNQQTSSSSMEIIAMPFFQTKRKWLLLGIYKPPKQDNSEFLETMNVLWKGYTETYENIITLRDFNMTVENPKLRGFMQLHDMSYVINELTFFQSHDRTCTDNILRNRKTMFKTSKTFESGLSDHHKLVSTIIKSGSFRNPPRKRYKNLLTTLIMNVLILP